MQDGIQKIETRENIFFLFLQYNFTKINKHILNNQRCRTVQT